MSSTMRWRRWPPPRVWLATTRSLRMLHLMVRADPTLPPGTGLCHPVAPDSARPPPLSGLQREVDEASLDVYIQPVGVGRVLSDNSVCDPIDDTLEGGERLVAASEEVRAPKRVGDLGHHTDVG